jgi:hypothetical protein
MMTVLSKVKSLEKGIANINVFFLIKILGYENKDTCNEIRNTNSNDNEPKYVVHVEDLVLLNNSLVIRLAPLHLLQQVLKPGDVDQLDQTRHSEQSEQFCERP